MLCQAVSAFQPAKRAGLHLAEALCGSISPAAMHRASASGCPGGTAGACFPCFEASKDAPRDRLCSFASASRPVPKGALHMQAAQSQHTSARAQEHKSAAVLGTLTPHTGAACYTAEWALYPAEKTGRAGLTQSRACTSALAAC